MNVAAAAVGAAVGVVVILATAACVAAPQPGAVGAGDRSERAAVRAIPSAAEAIRRLEAPRAVAPGQRREPIGDGADLGLDRLPLAELMRVAGVPGLSVAYFHDFEIQWVKAWGASDLETGAPVTPRTLFQAASISKPVTAAAVLGAVARGLLDLDRPVNAQLSSWRLPDNELTAARPVTMRMLLSHTGGTTVHGFPGYEPEEKLPEPQDILDGTGGANTAAVRVDLEPFTRERYSGGGTTILQVLLGDATGRPFPELLEEWVLRPAGMRDSAFEQPLGSERARTAARAHPGGAAGSVRWHAYPELAAAGLWTTAADLARFAIEVQRARRGERGRAVTPETAAAMTAPVGVGTFALGFRLQDRGSESGSVWYFGHSGGNWGFLCDLLAHADAGYGYVVMINGGRFDAIREIQERLAEIYRWDGDFSRPPRNWPPLG